jgi:tryptophan-rich sensory protein
VTSQIVLAVIWGLVVAGAGAWLTELSPWYFALRRPSWQPPDWLFGPAWTVILSLSSYTFYLAWRNAQDNNDRALIALLFFSNGALNLLWTPLFFKLRRPDWALIEVPFLWLSILAMMVFLMPLTHYAPLLLAPYLAWVTFAAVLNLTIVRLNRPFFRHQTP